jgi:two-component system OmpR family sensor kinase
MFRTLYGKLVAAFLVLICLLGLVYLGLTLVMTPLYVQEVNQSLNRSLADHIVESKPLIQDRQVNQAALEDIFHMLMVINPGIEIYLVDPKGRLMAFSAPPGKVKRERISLAPITAFLDGQAALPILGDDPRHPSRRKIFSAAPVMSEGRLQGYVYAVLGGELYDSVAQMVQASYILRLAAGAAAIGLLLTLVAGLLSFNWLTRRLRRLTTAVEAFKQRDFQRPMSLPAWRGRRGDEIDQLGLTIDQMSRRIMDQISQVHGADASRRELIANISHDLRTPMTSLQGYLETLVIKGDELSGEERRHYLDLAVLHSQRLSRLIDELFELAMLETQAPPLRFESFSLTELVQDVAQKFKLEAERKTLDLEVELPESAAFVSGDIGLIERVLENLIENAIKYTPKGGSIALALSAGPERIVTSVSDSGRGIEEADLPHIFERFYRAAKHRSGDPEGTGLGLAIAKRILQLHGSPIKVESRLGAGTRFSFQLPVANVSSR